MKETHDFRLLGKMADVYLPGVQTEWLDPNGHARRLELRSEQDIFREVGDVESILRARGERLFGSWQVKRTYSKRELALAPLFQLLSSKMFEPCGEDCGTTYDESASCPICGFGRALVGPLKLDTNRIPANASIAHSIARDELVVSRVLADLIVKNRITGVELEPVEESRELSDEGRRNSVPHVNDCSKNLIAGTTVNAFSDAGANRDKPPRPVRPTHRFDSRTPKSTAPWYRLTVVGPRLEVDRRTRFGINPFNADEEGKYRCPLGHVCGLRILSEIFAHRESYSGNDVVETTVAVGITSGVLRPYRLLLISPRFRELLVEEQIRGFGIEVAHFAGADVNS